jgi:hypothetical protein
LECTGGGTEGLADAFGAADASFGRLDEEQQVATGTGNGVAPWPDPVLSFPSGGKWTHSDNGIGSVARGVGRWGRDVVVGIVSKVKRNPDCLVVRRAGCFEDDFRGAVELATSTYEVAEDVLNGNFDKVWARVCAKGNGDCLEGLAYYGPDMVMSVLARRSAPAVRGFQPTGVAGPTRFIPGVTVHPRGRPSMTGTVDLGGTLDRIRTGGSFPHSRDGTVFGNREGRLPAQPYGYYTEYVHPTPGVRGPGPQRVVTGAGGDLWYTPDHYNTFVPLN